ncbi:MAG: hypothetical protein K8I30_11700 [Anaerolineae bacterium]|nr:hypothetical protein [Anaerolineae bacterium]
MAATGVRSENMIQARRAGYPASSTRFDLLATLLAGWFMIGLFVDGHAHAHGQVDNTFFTPWHALLYSGVLAVGVLLAVTQMRNVGRGYAWMKALPKGYLLSLIGVVLFFIGGGFDFVWHDIFGFEASNEALLSPAHLWLAGSALLFLTGPLRSAWGRKRDGAGWVELLPAVLTLTLLLSALTFFTMYANPMTQPDVFASRRPYNDVFAWDVTAIATVFVPAMLLSWIVLFSLRRWTLPFGAVAFIFTANAGLQYYLRSGYIGEFWPVIIGAAVAGLVIDGLRLWLKPSAVASLNLRAFAFAMPIIYFLIYFAILLLGGGIWWSIHMWLGVVLIAGFIGLLMSYLMVPPALERDTE